MRTGMIACCIGIGVVAWSPLLPPWWLLLLCSISAMLMWWRSRTLRSHWAWPFVCGLICGVAWGALYGAMVARSLLPVALEQQPLRLRGQIVELIETRQAYGRASQRFLLRVEDCRRDDDVSCNVPLHTVQLTAYQPLPIASGEHWRLRVKLKRPHGFANPGGFDFESWQVQRRISAVGSVDGVLNAERLAPASITSSDHWRALLRDRLQQQLAEFHYRGLLLALLVGDDSEITRDQWLLFRDTGTIHLFVVSGSHIAFTGGLVWWLGNVWRRSPLGTGSRREQLICVLPALVVAWLYALIAGMGLPIQRALIMFAVVLLSGVWRRHLRFFDVLLLALTLVLLRDPLAARDAGCWFSFAAVAALSLAFSLAPQRRVGKDGAGTDRWRWWRAQWLVFIVCVPILMMIGGQLTLLSLPANLIAVPLTTIVTLPAAFLALLSEPIAPVLAHWCWQVADVSLQGLLWLLALFSAYGGRLIVPLFVSPLSLLFALVAVLLLLLPRGVRVRYLAPVMLLPVLFPQPAAIDEQALRLTVFDVGQGLSVLIETRTHRLLYDTGPAFATGSSAAELAVLPALRQRNISALDLLLVSHRDSDHAGGVPAVLDAVRAHDVLVGEPLRLSPSSLYGQSRQRLCVAGQRWRWDGVEFAVLNPPASTSASVLKEGNNRSCVLRIDAGAGSVLLTGDIEAAAEMQLARTDMKPATVLIAPHHGSRTSSSPAFVAAVQPRYVVFSAGYHNPFGHPHARVVERYRQAGAQLLNTATSGAITFDLQPGGVAAFTEFRKGYRHYWDSPGFSVVP